MKKNLLHLPVLPVLTLLAAAAAAQGNQAPKGSTPVSAEASTTAPPVPSSSVPSRGAELFPMPVIPSDGGDPSTPAVSSSVSPRGAEVFPMLAIPADDGDTKAPAVTSSVPSRGAELFPMPVIPAADGDPTAHTVSSSVSSRGAELFPMPAIPDEDPATPAPLTEAEFEMQALIQNAIGKDATLNGDNVNVAISANGIELTGTVASLRARLAATRLAKSYAAGRKVVDKITVAVKSPPETSAEPSPTRADSAGTAHQRP